MNEKKITSNGYAFVLFSKDTLRNTLKKAKISENDLAQLFDKNDDFAELMMSSGSILPVVTASFNDYFFDIYFDKSNFFESSEWELLKEEEPFNLNVSDNEVWVASISELYEWNYSRFDTSDNIIGYKPLGDDEDFIYQAQKISIDTAIYRVTVQGYRRTKLVEEREKNYGFGFKITRIDSLLPLSEISRDNTFKMDYNL